MKGFKAQGLFFFLVLQFLLSHPLSATVTSQPTDFTVVISSKELEQIKDIYHLRGDVVISRVSPPPRGISRLNAQEVIYNSRTKDADLRGSLFYEDDLMTIKAERAELNLETLTGVLYDAEIIFKKDYMRIVTPEVHKISEDRFIFKKAMFTRCDGLIPDWCIKGRDVDFIRDDRVTARDATFNIKGIPVFYTPYLWAPALTERKTGFLIPSLGYSQSRGFELRQPFYIVLGGHADSTLLLDLYTERGIGKGLEFRLRGFPEDYLDLWIYHIRDTSLERDFHELRLSQNWEAQTDQGYLREFLSLRTATPDFYSLYIPHWWQGNGRESQLTRFLSSSSEVSYSRGPVRFFLSGLYWQDLKDRTDTVAQTLPEAGIILYPRSYKGLHYFLEARAGNFLREEGLKGQRLLLSPGLSYSAGGTLVLNQSLNLRINKYWLDGSGDNTDQRGLSWLRYQAVLLTGLERRYKALTHIIEPSLRFLREEGLGHQEPIDQPFDIRDEYKRRSELEMEVLNRFLFQSSTLLLRLSQPYNTLNGEWLPLRAEAFYSNRSFNTTLYIDYANKEGSLKTITFKTGLKVKGLSLSVSQRYSEDLKLHFLSTSANYDISKALAMNSTIWYDLTGGGLRNLLTGLSWKRQCWRLNLRYIQTPGDYSFHISIDLF